MGKTTALVVPTLLRCRSSTWLLDPKGELWEATAGWRARAMGHRCLRFAPTEEGTLRWNPLLAIPRGAGDVGDVATAAVLARNLVVSSASARESHWVLSARSLCTALALHVRYAPDVEPTMEAMRQVLSSRADHDALFGELSTYEHDVDGVFGWRDALTGEPTRTHPEVALLARRFLATPGRERGSILSTLQPFLDPWGDPRIAESTAESDFDFGPLLDGSPTTLYLSIPFHDLGRLAPLVRLQLAALGRALTRRPPESPHRLEVIVDEFASLGRLPILEDLLAFLRGYNARCVLLLQDLAQLHRLYGTREAITGNCRVHLVTATQNPATRRHASALAGTATARYRRTSSSRQGGRMGGGRRRTVSMTENSRPLITEGEVGALALDRALVFKAGAPPIRARLRPFFRDPELRRRAGIAPPGAGEAEPSPARGEPAPAGGRPGGRR
jgi:type IV secretion system protein VirD4